jgi:hypothetical protein
VIEQPYRVVAPALARPEHWCDILIVQVNIKRCSASNDGGGGTLAAFITRKPRDPVDSAYRVDFRYELATASADYLQVALNARAGPVGESARRNCRAESQAEMESVFRRAP